MNSKWYICTFVIILALFGLNQEQTKVANQQIVLQFTDIDITSNTAQDDALATVAKKLEAFGITKIELIEKDDAQLVIRYYSDIDALSIGEYLSQDGELELTYHDVDKIPIELPKEQLPETFSIVVTDLQQQVDDGFGLNGKLAFELNREFKRFSNPVVLLLNDIVVHEQDAIVKVAYKRNRVIAIAIDNNSDAIPEVRAGPNAYGSC